MSHGWEDYLRVDGWGRTYIPIVMRESTPVGMVLVLPGGIRLSKRMMPPQCISGDEPLGTFGGFSGFYPFPGFFRKFPAPAIPPAIEEARAAS